MDKPVLMILAAGMGSRYGGFKQIEPVGSSGESIIDFSIYDAIAAGFETVVLIIRREHESAFEMQLSSKIRPFINVVYAYQDLDDLPIGLHCPADREKPWGTTHAILAARDIIKSPFAVINADDYYGKDAFKVMYEFLSKSISDKEYAMIGYTLKNTSSLHGTVSRGVCIQKDTYLHSIEEHYKIGYVDNELKFQPSENQWVSIDPNSVVSMNFWGFTPAIFNHLTDVLTRFLQENLDTNPLKCEHVIPTAVGEGLELQQFKVRILPSLDRWYGITYREDKQKIVNALEDMKKQGLYPQNLWANNHERN